MTEQELMLLAKARRRRAEAAAQQEAAIAEQAPEEVKKDPGLFQQWVEYQKKNLTRSPGELIKQGVSDLVDIGDAGLNLLTSGVGSIVGGASAVPIMAGSALMGRGMNETVDTGNAVLENVADFLTYSPKTKNAGKVMGAVGEGMEAGMTAGRDVLHAAEDASGIPGLAVAGEIGAQGLLELVPGVKAAKARKLRLSQVPETSEAALAAKRLGIDLNNETIRDSVVEAGRTLSGDSSVATSGLEAVTRKVIEEKKAARRVVKAKYDALRATDAGVYAEPFVALGESLEKRLIEDGADFKNDTSLTQRINDLRNLQETIFGAPKGRDKRVIPGQSSTILGPDGKPMVPAEATPTKVPLNEIVALRSRVNGDISKLKRSDPEQVRHLQIVKRSLDDALEQQFLNDMMYGDKRAKQMWTDAKAANAEMMARFGDDRTIAKLADEALTATEIANLILGASENGAKAGALRTLRKVKGIIGKDQAGNDAIRTAVLAKIMEPLLGPTPQFSTFQRRVRSWSSKNGAILRELEISEADLRFLQRASQIAEKVKTTKMMHNMDNKTLLSSVISRLSFGHDIAKAGVRVKLANMFTDWAFGVGQKTHDQLLREFAVDPEAVLLKPEYPKLRYYALRAAAEAELQGRGDNEEE